MKESIQIVRIATDQAFIFSNFFSSYNNIKKFASSHDTEDLIDKLNSVLVNIMDWLNVNKPKKTKFMLIGSAHNLSAKGNEVTNSIIMNNSIIELVPSQKCLGVDLDNRLIFDIHIENVCKKTCSGIGAVRRIKPFVPLHSLINSFSSGHITYFDFGEEKI